METITLYQKITSKVLIVIYCTLIPFFFVLKANSSEAKVPLITTEPKYPAISSSCDEAAQPFIDQGLNWFYGFQFANALVSFEAAFETDKTCVAALWGIALNAKGNPNSRYLAFKDDPEKEGLKAIQKAIELRSHANQLSRELTDALSKFYLPLNIDQKRKDRNYTQAMLELQKKLPSNPDINTLFAEAFMTENAWDYWTPDGSPRPGTIKAVDALNEALNNDPNHPGANHLFIHIYEDSQTPQIALPHAERLANIMPTVAHMVHMPAHIYIRTGKYQKSIEQNLHAIEAAEQFSKRWKIASKTHFVSLPMSPKSSIAHADDFIWYAYLEQGNYKKSIESANRIANRVKNRITKSLMAQGRYVLPMLTNRIFAKWDKILANENDSSDSQLIKGIGHFVKGTAYINTGDLEKALTEYNKLKIIAVKEDARNMQIYSNSVQDILLIATNVLDAEIAVASGEIEKAIALYHQAIIAEDNLNYMEPPEWRFPVRRELGSLLLKLGRPQEATTIFWEDLRRHPENGWALHGVVEGASQTKDLEEKQQATDRLKKAWEHSDTELDHAQAKRL